jgi:hypothetical protein
MALTDSLAGDIAREFVQIQGYGQTLFTRHAPIVLDLLIEGSGRGHQVPNKADADF